MSSLALCSQGVPLICLPQRACWKWVVQLTPIGRQTLGPRNLTFGCQTAEAMSCWVDELRRALAAHAAAAGMPTLPMRRANEHSTPQLAASKRAVSSAVGVGASARRMGPPTPPPPPRAVMSASIPRTPARLRTVPEENGYATQRM